MIEMQKPTMHGSGSGENHLMGFRRTLQLTSVPIILLISDIHGIADKTDCLVLHVRVEGHVQDGIYIAFHCESRLYLQDGDRSCPRPG